MPPKAKFTQDEIVQAALNIIRKEGIKALTARALGERLGSSARPIFTVFENMEEVQQAVMEAAKKLYNGYIEEGLKEDIAFKGVGKQYILFAIKEPKLFQLLFMSEQNTITNVSDVLPLIDDSYDEILLSIKNGYGLNDELSLKLYRHLWIYSHGIAALCATNMCKFTAQQIENMMSEVFLGLLKKLGE